MDNSSEKRVAGRLQVTHRKVDQDYYLLTVHNLSLNDFLDLFSEHSIEHIAIYWLESDQDYLSLTLQSFPASDLRWYLQHSDVSISTVELKLSNGFRVDSNFTDALFCKIPASCDMNPLVARIIKSDWLVTKNQPPSSSFSSHIWITKPVRKM